MKKLLALSAFLLLPVLASCGNGDNATPVKLDFGTRIGLEEEISFRSHLTFVKRSKVNQLVSDKGNFVLIVHGSADTCTCYSDWHEKVLVPYVKLHKALIYAIDLEEFESDSNYLGLTRISGVDTLAIFENGLAKFQHTTEDLSDKWVTDFATFNDWMRERVVDAKIFHVDEELLDSYYDGTTPFTVYFSLENCPDCRYLSRNGLRTYLQGHETVESNFFYFDMAPYWTDEGNLKALTKAKYGLSYFKGNDVGFEKGYVPTIFYVNPDGINYYGDVVEAAGVFYNETNVDGIVGRSYFTEERLEEAGETYLTYLAESSLKTKVIEGLNVGAVPKDGNKHDLIAQYEDPIFYALLDYAIGA